MSRQRPQHHEVSLPETPFEDLLDHIGRHSVLGRPEAARLVRDVLAYFDESTEAFVKRRHREMRGQGLANPMIFQRIAEELKGWRVAPPLLSERQIRRIIYG